VFARLRHWEAASQTNGGPARKTERFPLLAVDCRVDTDSRENVQRAWGGPGDELRTQCRAGEAVFSIRPIASSCRRYCDRRATASSSSSAAPAITSLGAPSLSMRPSAAVSPARGEDAMSAHAEIIPSVVERIKRSLVGLKMPRAIEILDATVRRIEHGEMNALEAIDALLTEELTLRENRRVKMALVMARLSAIKTLAGFDFSLQPSLDKNRIMALAEHRPRRGLASHRAAWNR
jgi:hypothetical protein